METSWKVMETSWKAQVLVQMRQIPLVLLSLSEEQAQVICDSSL
jgi:hypothetical protein